MSLTQKLGKKGRFAKVSSLLAQGKGRHQFAKSQAPRKEVCIFEKKADSYDRCFARRLFAFLTFLGGGLLANTF